MRTIGILLVLVASSFFMNGCAFDGPSLIEKDLRNPFDFQTKKASTSRISPELGALAVSPEEPKVCSRSDIVVPKAVADWNQMTVCNTWTARSEESRWDVRLVIAETSKGAEGNLTHDSVKNAFPPSKVTYYRVEPIEGAVRYNEVMIPVTFYEVTKRGGQYKKVVAKFKINRGGEDRWMVAIVEGWYLKGPAAMQLIAKMVEETTGARDGAASS